MVLTANVPITPLCHVKEMAVKKLPIVLKPNTHHIK